MKSMIIRTLFMMGALFALAANPAHAVVEININKGNVTPLPIAITDFLAKDGVGKQISDVVAADLKRSGLFAPIDSKAFIEKITNPSAAPRFQDWRTINAQALVTGQVVKEADGRLRAEFRSGTFSPASRSSASSISRSRKTTAASPTSLPMRSMKRSRARRAISTPASCSWPKAVRRMPASASSRSWTRTASMSVRSPIPTTSF